jgi:hypothetical protein
MNCIDTDTALTVVQSLGDDAGVTIKHLATCPACAATLADVSVLHQSFRNGAALSEDTIRYIYEGIRSAPQEVTDPLETERGSTRPMLAGVTFLASVLAVLGIALFPGLYGIFQVAEGYWLRLLLVVLVACVATWPELLHPLTRSRIWQTRLQLP